MMVSSPLPPLDQALVEVLRLAVPGFGTVTADANVGGNTVTDSTKQWSPDILRNKLFKVVRGEGVGVHVRIAGNAGSTLRLANPLTRNIGKGATYVIVGDDQYQNLLDALNSGLPVTTANPLQVEDPKVGSLISFEGTTTADGAADGSTLICADLAALTADYDGLVVIIRSGAYEGEAHDINGTTLAGTVTPNIPFTGQIVNGVDFVIAAVTTTPAEIAALVALVTALMADVGDASASTLGSLYAILGDPAQNFSTMVGYEGATSLANKLTAARAAFLDAAISSRAPSATALSTAIWTNALATALGNYTAARAGYLDELAAANIPADIDELIASKNRDLHYLEFSSNPQEEVQVTSAANTKALPSVTVHDIPAGATVVIAKAEFFFRVVENTNAAANALDGGTVAGTSQVIQVRSDAPGTWRDGINFVDNQFGLAATANLREGGTVCKGSVNIAAEVTGNDTYEFQWLLAKSDQNNLQFNDCQTVLKIWYSV